MNERIQRANRRLMTGAEVSAMLRTPLETLRYWRGLGRGPKSIKLGRRVLYDEADVIAWLDGQTNGAA